METNVNNVDVEAEDSPDELAAEQFVQKLIETRDSKCEQLMSQCSDRAKQIRNKINEMLESRDALTTTGTSQTTTDGQPATHIDTESLLQLQKELELEISGLSDKPKPISNDHKSDINSSDTNDTNDSNGQNIKTDDTSEPKVIENCGQTNGSNKVTKPNEDSDSVSTTKNDSSSRVSKTEDKTANDLNAKTNSNSSRKQVKYNSKYGRMSAENINKKLSTFGSDAERITFLTNSLVEVSEENRNFSQQLKQNERVCTHLSKEKDQMQSEQNRLVLAKSRLESLCRELQRQNKIIKEESLLKIKEEEEKRREIANKFQSTLNEIMQLIAENQKRNTQLKEENADLAQKLKTLMGHYESWEKHTEKIIKQKDLETQLMKAKFSKTEMILNQEQKIFIKEKTQLIQMIGDLQKRCADMTQNENKLRTELGLYTNKYDEFQTVLTKSNDMFATFKKDMERMSKQIKKLEKETQQWKNRWETSNKALLKLSDEV